MSIIKKSRINRYRQKKFIAWKLKERKAKEKNQRNCTSSSVLNMKGGVCL